MRPGRIVVAICTAALLPPLPAQNLQPIEVEKPTGSIFYRPYLSPTVPPARLANSGRLATLLRAGKLYITAQDAVALAIENNLDLEVDRYGPLLATSAHERAQAGGPVRGVPSASAQVSGVNSGVGVNGSAASAGLSSGGGGGGGGNNGGASIQQIGAITPNLDPVLQNTTVFSHLSQPQANTLVSQTSALVISQRTYNTVLQQGLISGGLIQFRDYGQHLSENAPTDVLNPVEAPHMDILIRHNLLQNFGVGLNNRSIRIARKNMDASRETFRSQLIDLVTNVLNQYWVVVSGYDELKARRHALDVAQKFLEDTRKEISLGVQARYELPRAEAEAATRRNDLLIAEANVAQQSDVLKDLLSRKEDAALQSAEIVPLDHIQVPEKDELPPLRELVVRAMKQRPDVAVSKIKDEVAEINAIGTENPLMPTLQASFQTFNRGLAGTYQPSSGEPRNSYFVGGYGTALGQIFRRDFPNNQASIYLQMPFNNRQAQGDYGVDQLQLQQSALTGRRDANQIVVDISNQLSFLRQSRARFSAASNTRGLQEQLLAADQKRFASGTATLNELVTDQRNLATAQISEVTAMATYARAQVALDQVLGETLEKNHISIDDAIAGHVTTPSESHPEAKPGR